MAVGGLHQMEPFREALSGVKKDYPGTDEAKAAAALLAHLDQAEGKPAAATASGPSYTDGKGAHFVVLMVPDSAGRMPKVLAAISDFDQHNFRDEPMEVKPSIYDDSTQVVLIRMFQTKEKAMHYYDLFRSNRTDLAEVNNQGWPLFAISTGNYQLFYMAKDEGGYQDFFSRTYLVKK